MALQPLVLIPGQLSDLCAGVSCPVPEAQAGWGQAASPPRLCSACLPTASAGWGLWQSPLWGWAPLWGKGMGTDSCHTAHRGNGTCALCLAGLFPLGQAEVQVLLWALCSSWLDTPGLSAHTRLWTTLSLSPFSICLCLSLPALFRVLGAVADARGQFAMPHARP